MDDSAKIDYVSDIASYVDTELCRKTWLNYSLLGGDFGAICFLYYYSKVDPKYGAVADRYLDKMLSGITRRPFVYTYCNGIAGLGIGLQLLEHDGFLEGVSTSLDEYDRYLCGLLPGILNLKSIDFLHGVIGVGLYFVSRDRHNPELSLQCIDRIVGFLYSSSKKKGNTIYWELEEDDYYKRFNISLSHGASSILIFLSRVNSLDLKIENKQYIRPLIDGIINYILEQKMDEEKVGSFFPSFPRESGLPSTKSRLAWCYGDLGIAIALKEAAKSINDPGLYGFGVEVLKFSAAKRRDVKANSIHDAGLCHGAMGVSQIFKRSYEETRDNVFKQASEYWREVALSFAKPEDGKMIFKSYNNQTDKWENSINILEGNAGIGLCLIGADSFINKILLLS